MKVFLCFSDVESRDFMGVEVVDKVVATEALAREWMRELAEPEESFWDARCGLEDTRVGIERYSSIRDEDVQVQTRRVQVCEVEGSL